MNDVHIGWVIESLMSSVWKKRNTFLELQMRKSYPREIYGVPPKVYNQRT